MKTSAKNSHSRLRTVVLIITGLLVLLSSTTTGLMIFFNNRIYPGISINGLSVSALTPDQARDRLNQFLSQRTNQTVDFSYQNQHYLLDLKDSHPQLDIDQTIAEAMEYGRLRFYFRPIQLSLHPQFDNSFHYSLLNIEKNVNQLPLESQIRIDGDNITVTPSQDGLVVDEPQLKNQLAEFINTGQTKTQILPMKKAYPQLSYQSALAIKKILDQIKISPLKLTYQGQAWTLDLTTLVSILDLTDSQSSLVSTNVFDTPITIQSLELGQTSTLDPHLRINKDKLDQYLQTIAKSIDRDVQEPLFNFDGKRVTQFQPPIKGQKLNLDQSEARLVQAITSQNYQPVSLAVDITEPKNRLSNELGIKELIGEGVSNFAHSIPNRIFNIGLAASRINGVLIPPGDTFSFVKTVGDISAASGYKQGYIIKEGRTVLDDGGGVCQVSTTLFRSALNAGLPIPARTAHAYRVEYYEQGFPPGLDATIFSPSVDFKFRNDTPASILIQTHIDGLTLYIDLYGTSDNRTTTMSKPVILSQTPPLPEIRQDDPTLPKGTVKQVDFPAWGANVVFTRTVTRNGQTLINETYRSNYRPWQAVFLVGTKEG